MFGFGKKEQDLGIVKCEECKHYIEVSDAQIVKRVNGYIYVGAEEECETPLYFCNMHTKPYDLIRTSKVHFKQQYYRERVLVDEDGTPFGYIDRSKVCAKCSEK